MEDDDERYCGESGRESSEFSFFIGTSMGKELDFESTELERQAGMIKPRPARFLPEFSILTVSVGFRSRSEESGRPLPPTSGKIGPPPERSFRLKSRRRRTPGRRSSEARTSPD